MDFATVFFVVGFLFLVASGVIFEKSFQQMKEVKRLHQDCKELYDDLQEAGE